ncbi:MAG: TVP38/TMEM64 family protein [Phycisphaeraceae bacterium]|nr:TVP38/TMEM64 family protein [Phycisphaeraceae bacterium]
MPPPDPSSGPPTRNWLKALGPTAILGALWTASPAILGTMLLVYLGPISEWLRDLGEWGLAVYAAVFVVSAGVGFLPTYGQSFLGGWTFGFATGFPGAMVGFVGGSVIGHLIAKTVSRHKVLDLLESNPKAKAVRDALIGRGFWKTLGIVTLIRVPPNSPFALTNLVLASTGVGMVPYILGTAIGMAPRTAIAVYFAAIARSGGARDIAQLIEETPWWLTIAGIATFVIVLAVIARIANKAIEHVTITRPQAHAAAAPPIERPGQAA